MISAERFGTNQSGGSLSVNSSQSHPAQLLTEKEACAFTRLSRLTLHRARKEGRLAFYRVGSRVLYSTDHLHAFIRRNECRYEGAA
jgi:excisionase family DNA binding protein